MKRLIPALLLLTLVLGLAAPVMAQEPAKERCFVYVVYALAGGSYTSGFYPPGEKTLYLLADKRNVIAPRYTLVYFWHITNEYKPDWSGLNEVAEGTLEVLQGNRVVASFPLTDYIIQYYGHNPADTVTIYEGREAKAKYEAFDKARKEWIDRLWDYYKKRREYNQQLAEIAGKGEKPAEIPEPPPEPEPFDLFSTNVSRGFVVSLAEGTYRLRVRGDAGQIIPDSERKLVVFSPRRRGVGYVVLPQTRWTIPERADDPRNVLYTPGQATLYLQPFVEEEYNELFYTKLENPQSREGRAEHWVWVHLKPLVGGVIELLQDGKVVDRIERKPFYVEQLPGPALGYKVVEGDPQTMKRSPDFEGYKVEIKDVRASSSLRLVEDDGTIIEGSQRRMRRISTQNTWALYVLPFVPLAFGLGLVLQRRIRIARPALALRKASRKAPRP